MPTIEIGVAVIDLDSRERVGKQSVLVRPQRSRVSAFCVELTGITQDMADTGVSFPEACRTLARDYAAGERPWASWGDYDRKQFRRQCGATATDCPFTSRHTNAKAVFADALSLPRRVGMAQALALACLPLEGRHHRGGDDAWNIAALILRLADRGAWPGA